MHQFEFLNSIDEVPDTTEMVRELLSVFAEVVSDGPLRQNLPIK